MEVLITNRQKLLPISTDQMQKTARALLNALDRADAELSILVVDDRQIAAVNRQYLNRTGPTNVIAFPMQEGDCSGINPQLLGDVVISIETAEREAAVSGVTTEERFTELLIHGILHLLGYDHETNEADAAEMAEKSDALLEILRRGE